MTNTNRKPSARQLARKAEDRRLAAAARKSEAQANADAIQARNEDLAYFRANR